LFIDKPGKPAATKITKIGKNSATLSWESPKSDGGAEITNYVIEYRIEGGFKWVRIKDVVSDTKHTVKSLVEGNTYEFRVSAENKAGIGPASDPTTPAKTEEKIGEENKSFLLRIFMMAIISIGSLL